MEPQKALLPPSEVGEDRCFEIGYFGHGDIIMSTWQGDVDHTPSARDGVSKRFGLAHGRDPFILASMAGYLRRSYVEQDEVRAILHGAAEEAFGQITTDTDGWMDGFLAGIADGEDWPYYDREDLGLECLMAPQPAHPGTVERSGGTGMYTNQAGQFVIAAFAPPTTEKGELELLRAAEFVQSDIPIMARLVCNLALGEYRQSVQEFLETL